MNTIHVAAAIIESDGRILAAQRGSGPMKDGWEFPGGKVEPAETAEEACRREILEELGAGLGTCWQLTTVEHDYPDFHLSMDCFVCSLGEGQRVTMLEHEDMRWLAREDLSSVRWLPADEELIGQIGTFWDQIFLPEHL